MRIQTETSKSSKQLRYELTVPSSIQDTRVNNVVHSSQSQVGGIDNRTH